MKYLYYSVYRSRTSDSLECDLSIDYRYGNIQFKKVYFSSEIFSYYLLKQIKCSNPDDYLCIVLRYPYEPILIMIHKSLIVTKSDILFQVV